MKDAVGNHKKFSKPHDTPFRLDDPFDGYFRERPESRPPKAQSLLDIPAAKRWFKIVEWGSKVDLYTFQQRFDSKSGPEIYLDGQRLIMMSSYDYLGLIGHPEIEAAAMAAVREYGTGTGGVRMLTGTNRLHARLESAIADFKGTEAALTFSSGYVANLAVISALLGKKDRVFLDSLAHRSIVDACRLAQVPVHYFQHNDMSDLRMMLATAPPARRTLIIAEGVYSMDGDICPLPELLQIKQQADAFLMIDEAHAIGTVGRCGAGINQHFGIAADAVDIWMGSLSKAIPGNGGYLAGTKDLMIYLQHGAAPFMFSAALCPSATAAALAAIDIIRKEPSRLTLLNDNADYLRQALQALGYDIGRSATCIIPVILGSDEAAYRLSRELFARGIFASAVVFPAVARGKARLRLCVTAAHTREILDTVIAAFASPGSAK